MFLDITYHVLTALLDLEENRRDLVLLSAYLWKCMSFIGLDISSFAVIGSEQNPRI